MATLWLAMALVQRGLELRNGRQINSEQAITRLHRLVKQNRKVLAALAGRHKLSVRRERFAALLRDVILRPAVFAAPSFEGLALCIRHACTPSQRVDPAVIGEREARKRAKLLVGYRRRRCKKCDQHVDDHETIGDGTLNRLDAQTGVEIELCLHQLAIALRRSQIEQWRQGKSAGCHQSGEDESAPGIVRRSTVFSCGVSVGGVSLDVRLTALSACFGPVPISVSGWSKGTVPFCGVLPQKSGQSPCFSQQTLPDPGFHQASRTPYGRGAFFPILVWYVAASARQCPPHPCGCPYLAKPFGSW